MGGQSQREATQKAGSPGARTRDTKKGALVTPSSEGGWIKADRAGQSGLVGTALITTWSPPSSSSAFSSLRFDNELSVQMPAATL